MKNSLFGGGGGLLVNDFLNQSVMEVIKCPVSKLSLLYESFTVYLVASVLLGVVASNGIG